MTIRRLTSADAALVASLMAELGYPICAVALAERLNAVLSNPSDAVLIAESDGGILGLIAVHSFEMLHLPGRLGRITELVVAASSRGRGIGRQLLNAAEDHLRTVGCVQLEVTSGEQRSDAHRFYAARGYVEKRVRFVKSAAI